MTIEGISQTSQSMPLMGMGHMQPPNPTEMSSNLINDLDTDGDGLLSISELEAAGQFGEEIATADTDGDGNVSQEELISQIVEKMEEMGKPPMMMDGQMPDINDIKGLLAQMSTESSNDDDDTEQTQLDAQSGYDMISQILDRMGMSEEESENILNMLQNSQLNLEM